MRRPVIALQLPDRSHARYITESEMAQMKAAGSVIVVVARKGRTTLRLRPEVKPSNSNPSPQVLSFRDTLIAVGIQPRLHCTLDVSAGQQAATRAKTRYFKSPRSADAGRESKSAVG